MKPKINHPSRIPLHIQAEELLRKLIKQEEYKNGKLLPNEVDLSEQMYISRHTLRQTINHLVTNKLLIREKRHETKVSKKRYSVKPGTG